MLDNSTLACSLVAVSIWGAFPNSATYSFDNSILGIIQDGRRCVTRIADNDLLLRRRREAQDCEQRKE